MSSPHPHSGSEDADDDDNEDNDQFEDAQEYDGKTNNDNNDNTTITTTADTTASSAVLSSSSSPTNTIAAPPPPSSSITPSDPSLQKSDSFNPPVTANPSIIPNTNDNRTTPTETDRPKSSSIPSSSPSSPLPSSGSDPPPSTTASSSPTAALSTSPLPSDVPSSTNAPAPSPPEDANAYFKDPLIDDPNARFMVKNLDTGEMCVIDQAEKVFPEVAATSAFTLASFDSAMIKHKTKDGEPVVPSETGEKESKATKKEEIREQLKAMGYTMLDKLKSIAKKMESSDHSKTDGKTTERSGSGSDKDKMTASNTVKVKTKKKQMMELSDVRLIQEVQYHAGPIWTVAISPDGQFLATAGQDSIVRVWAIGGTAAAKEIEERYHNDSGSGGMGGAGKGGGKDGNKETKEGGGEGDSDSPAATLSPTYVDIPRSLGGRRIIYPIPYRQYSGHKADVIDLSWSKANFLLSASVDKTVRLWHISRTKCLCLFQHADFVTAVAFHPIEDRYFISGSFDKKLRIWNIPEHRVVEWAQTSNIITAAAFSPNGLFAGVGLYNGQCVFYQTEGLKYFTQIDCKNRRGKNRHGKKVTGIQWSKDGKFLLVSTNDSRLRLYNMDDYSIKCKYKGLQNDELQIRAYFSESCEEIICGSENESVYVWKKEEGDHDNGNDHDDDDNNSETNNNSNNNNNNKSSNNNNNKEGKDNANNHDGKNDNGKDSSEKKDDNNKKEDKKKSEKKKGGGMFSSLFSSSGSSSNEGKKNDSYEYFKATTSTVTCAQFITKAALKNAYYDTPYAIDGNNHNHHNHNNGLASSSSFTSSAGAGNGLNNNNNNNNNDHTEIFRVHHLIVAAGYDGELKFFENRGNKKEL